MYHTDHQSPSPIIECHIVGQRAETLWNHAYIRQLVQQLIYDIFKLQLDILVVYYSLTRTQQIVCAVYHKYANLFLCGQKISKVYTLMYVFSPIAYCSLSTECPWLSIVFKWHPTIIALFWQMFFNKAEIEKSLMLPCISLTMIVVLLWDGCRTLPTYKM